MPRLSAKLAGSHLFLATAREAKSYVIKRD